MKKLLTTSVALSVLIVSAPALAEGTVTSVTAVDGEVISTECTNLRRTDRAACMRLKTQSDGLKKGIAKRYIQRNKGVLKQVRYNRRSDDKDDKLTLKEQRMKNLEERKANRLKTFQSHQSRIDQKKEWQKELQEKRLTQLRDRIKALTPSNVMTREEFRTRARKLDANTQSRRETVKRIHEECRSQRGAERIECMRKKTEDQLD